MNRANLIVARIERARQDRGISVAELARRINVDRKRLWYVLNGQRSMHVEVPSRFLRTFGQPYTPASRCASSSSVTSR